MRYAIVTVQWLLDRGFSVEPHWRKSLDGSRVLLHYGMIQPILCDGEEVELYEWDSKELNDILSSPEWSSRMDDVITS